MSDRLSLQELTPKRTVSELSKYIIGQDEAKRIVAIALRNRYRRSKLEPEVRQEVNPKNILLIGPTGVGKTEIARRLSQISSSPFLKVEATKYTEIGYVGRNVDSMVRDLVESSIAMVRSEEIQKLEKKLNRAVEDRLVEAIMQAQKKGNGDEEALPDRTEVRRMLQNGVYENLEIEIRTQERRNHLMQVFTDAGMEDIAINMADMFGGPAKTVKKKMTVAEARRYVREEESLRLLDNDKIVEEGKRRAEESGIIFIDEIDKIIATGKGHGPDVSREGVQRDLLPIVEGSNVNSRYGSIRTHNILFIGAGAFSSSKPSDLIPELQGRFPLRAELTPLTKKDFHRILLEPKNAVVKQYVELMKTEDVHLTFTDDAIEEIATIAEEVNSTVENIGARRLYTIVEKVLEEISFNAPDIAPTKIVIDRQYVREQLKKFLQADDVRKYIL